MATDVTEQQTVALKRANVFSVALVESIDVKDNPRLAIAAEYCSNGEVHEELCCLKPILYMALLKKKIYLTSSPRILSKEGSIHVSAKIN